MTCSRTTIAIACIVLGGCATTQERRPGAAESTSIILPEWAEPLESSTAPSPPTVPRSFDTHVIQQAPQQTDSLASVMRGRGDRKIANLSFHQAPVAEVLRMLASTGGFNLVIADGVPDRKVTLDLRNVTVRHAFEAVLASAALDADAIGTEIVLVKPASSQR